MKHLQSSTLFSLLALATGIATSACGGSTSSGGKGGPGGTDGGHSGDGGQNTLDGGGGGDDGGGTGDDGGGGGPEGGPVVVDAGPPGTAVQLYYCLGGVYTATTTIGTQDFELNIDTGSTSLGVAGSTCSTCGVTPEYTPGATATDQKQATNAQYGSGSWNGEVYQDDVGMAPATAFPLKFASITSQNSFFNQTLCNSKNGGMQGILGMGPDQAISPGTEGYFTGLVAAQHVTDMFSIELCDSGGTLWLGGFGDSSVMTAAPQYVPIIGQIAQYYYAVDLASVTVNGVKTAIGAGSGASSASIVDTGTSTFLMSTTAYTSITNAIKNAPGVSAFLGASANQIFPAGGGGGTLTCGNITGSKAVIDAALPGMTFTFGNGVTVQSTATESYIFPLQSEWCSGLSGVPANALGGLSAIWGSPMHRSSVIIYDRQGSERIGFAPHTPCN